MAYVPGFEHDVFISYAHGDDRDWINSLMNRLRPELKRRLGIEPTIWMDKDDLRSSRDSSKEIPESVRSSAVFVLLPSPTYIRSSYCVGEECRAYGETIPDKRKRYGGDFANEEFALRCPLLPVDNNEHWQLFSGLSDIAFCDDTGTFPLGSPEFEVCFRKLTGELMQVLKRMRNRSTSVFVYPPNPSNSVREAYDVLSKELSAGSYRLLPDRLVNVEVQLREASLTVFLMGDSYDETANQLINSAKVSQKPWVVWCSPASQNVPSGQEQQLGLLKDLEEEGPAGMTFLDAATNPSKLKEEVLALLRPNAVVTAPASGKPSVYLIYNPREQDDRVNAGRIKLHYQDHFHFDTPDDLAQRTVRLMSSDGVMVIWGKSDETWCSREFESMMQVSRREQSKGLCLFDPKEAKIAVADQIRRSVSDLYIAEEYGRFEPAKLEALLQPNPAKLGGRAMNFTAVLERLQAVENPYPGLRPFETSEAHLFFGRDQQIAELLVRLQRDRFVAVVGVSGSGKSSLVRAGLIPALERGQIQDSATRWSIVLTRPAGTPLISLADDLRGEGLDPAPLRQSSYGLIHVAQQLAPDQSLLVVVDQFEELFRYKDQAAVTAEARREREQEAAEAYEFVQLLLTASRNQPPVYIVITMRSDYLGDCAEFRDLPEALNECQYLIPRLTREQRKQAIECPLGNTEISPALVQRMLNDAGDEPDQLPILQHALMRTWDHWRKADPKQHRKIELQDYEAIGGFDNALDQHADELLKLVTRNIAATVFKRLTARRHSERERREPAKLSEILDLCDAKTHEQQAEVIAIINRFRQREATFLLPSDGDLKPGTYIDIGHESLVRQWKMLRDGWMPEEAKSAKIFLDLVERSRNWRSRGGALLSGLDFADALEWERRRNRTSAWATHYANESALATVLEFINASQAEERKRVVREKRNFLIAVAVAVVFAILASIAVYEGRQARSQAAIASARQLLASSISSEGSDPELSVLFAARAISVTWPWGHSVLPEGEDELHRAVMASRVRQTLHGHGGPVNSVAWSPDGKRLATASGDQTAKVWDATTGNVLVTLRGHGARVYSVAWSPDGEHLATGSGDQTAKVWDAASGQELLTLRGHDGAVTGVAWSPDSKRLATGSADQTAKVWDAANGQELMTLRGHGAFVASVAWSPDSKRLATASGDQTAKVWDAIGGRQLLTMRSTGAFVASVAWSPDGHRLVMGSADQTAKVWDADSGQELLALRGHDGAVVSVAWSPDGKRLVTGSDDQTAQVWNAVTGQVLFTLRGHGGPVNSVAWNPDNMRLATGSADHTAKLWDAASGQELLTLRGHDSAVASVAWSPDSKRLATTGSADQTANVWDAASGQELLTLHGDGARVYSVAWSPDGKRLATASYDHTAKVWDAATGKEVLTMSGHHDLVLSVAWSPDGQRLATASYDHTAKVWDAKTGKEVLTMSGHSDVVSSVAWSPDGQRLATASHDQTAKVWDAETGKEVLTLSGHHDLVLSVAWSPDGRRLATASHDQTVKVWDAETGKEVLTLSGHHDLVLSVAWSPDGRRLATGSWDRTAKVWDAETGKEVMTLSGHSGAVYAVAWSPGGKYLATASDDGTVQVYAMDIKSLMDLARQRVTALPSVDGCKKYLHADRCPPFPTLP